MCLLLEAKFPLTKTHTSCKCLYTEGIYSRLVVYSISFETCTKIPSYTNNTQICVPGGYLFWIGHSTAFWNATFKRKKKISSWLQDKQSATVYTRRGIYSRLVTVQVLNLLTARYIQLCKCLHRGEVFTLVIAVSSVPEHKILIEELFLSTYLLTAGCARCIDSLQR